MNSKACVGLGPWLDLLLTRLVKPDKENEVPRCDSAP